MSSRSARRNAHKRLAHSLKEGTLTVRDQAEERAFWNLHCLLEKQLVEIFHADYKALLVTARQDKGTLKVFVPNHRLQHTGYANDGVASISATPA